MLIWTIGWNESEKERGRILLFSQYIFLAKQLACVEICVRCECERSSVFDDEHICFHVIYSCRSSFWWTEIGTSNCSIQTVIFTRKLWTKCGIQFNYSRDTIETLKQTYYLLSYFVFAKKNNPHQQRLQIKQVTLVHHIPRIADNVNNNFSLVPSKHHQKLVQG